MKTIKIKGMSCGHCTASVKEALEKLENVSNVEVDLEKGEASFDGNPSDSLLKETIEGIGFELV